MELLKERAISFIKQYGLRLRMAFAFIALVIASFTIDDDFVKWASEKAALALVAVALLLCLGVYLIERVIGPVKSD